MKPRSFSPGSRHQREQQPELLATALIRLGNAWSELGLVEQERVHVREALRLFRETGNRRGTVAALNNLGSSLLETDLDAGKVYLEEALAISYDLDNHQSVIHNLLNLAQLELRRSDTDAAQVYFRECLQRTERGGFSVLMIYTCGFIGWFAEIQQQDVPAARLFGAFEALAAPHNVGQNLLVEREQRRLQQSRERVRARLGETLFTSLYRAGQQFSLPQTLAFAYEVIGISAEPTRQRASRKD